MRFASYDVRGLTARRASLRLARSVVLWIGCQQDEGRDAGGPQARDGGSRRRV